MKKIIVGLVPVFMALAACTSSSTNDGGGASVCGEFNSSFELCDTRDSSIYAITEINGLQWMAENLNYGQRISSIEDQDPQNGISEKYCAQNLDENCDVYGGLYQFSEAMADICPEDWRLPTKQEWIDLIAAADENEMDLYYGEDTDFDSQLSGGRFEDGIFRDLGKQAYYRTSDNLYVAYINSERRNGEMYYGWGPTGGFSVRCVKGKIAKSSNETSAPSSKQPTSSLAATSSTVKPSSSSVAPSSSSLKPSSSSVAPSSSSLKPSSSSVAPSSSSQKQSSSSIALPSSSLTPSSSSVSISTSCGMIDPAKEMCDERDDQIYPIVSMGDQVWMAKNLNYGTRISSQLLQSTDAGIQKFCQENTDANCNTYGGLYQYSEATQACPTGWHLPNVEEWQELIAWANDQGLTLLSPANDGGFDVLLGGGSFNSGTFRDLGAQANFRTSVDLEVVYMNSNFREGVVYHGWGPTGGFSVRCLKTP